MDKLLKILNFLKPLISGLGTLFGWLFIRHIYNMFQKTKEFFSKGLSFLRFLVRKAELFLQDIKTHPQRYVIIILSVCVLGLGFTVIKPYFHINPPVVFNNSYDISLNSEKVIHIVAGEDGTINEINGKIKFFTDHPDKTVSFTKGETLMSFDSAAIDNQLKDLRQTFYNVSGSRTVISQETINSPDEAELISIQAQINSLKIQEDQKKTDLINLESQYYQAKNLYDQRVVTQSYLDNAVFNYSHAKSDLATLDSNIDSLQKLYRQKSSASKHNTITITTRGSEEDANQANVWLEESKKKINDLNNQKSKMTIVSPSNCILKSVYIRLGQSVKKDTILLDTVDLNSLIAVIQLKKEDLKLIKEEKAKVYFVNQNTSTKLEIQNYELVNNKLSFNLFGDEMINHYKEAKVIVERD